MDKFYSKTHEWVIIDDETAIIGISAYAAKELGDITYVELPGDGADFIVGDVASSVESVKAASDVYSPISGTVTSINHNLEDDPGLINRSAEEKGWIYKMDNIDFAELDDLMDEKKYQKFLKSL